MQQAKKIQKEENAREQVEIGYSIIKIQAAKERKSVSQYLSELSETEKADLLNKLPEGSKIVDFGSNPLEYIYGDQYFEIALEDNTLNETIQLAGNVLEDYRIYGNSIQTATPMPTSPVPVVSLGESGKIDVISSGKNLLDMNIATQQSSYYGVDIKNKYDKDITLSISLKEGKTIPSGVSFGLVNYQSVDASATADWLIRRGNFEKSKTSTYWENKSHIADYSQYYKFFVGCYPGNKVTWDLVCDSFNIQLEYGNNVSTEYEPYQEPKVTTIDLTGHEPLRKIGDVADYIDYKNKKIVRNVGVTTFKGTERWSLPTSIVDGYSAYRLLSFFPKTPVDSFLCSHFVNLPKSNYSSSPIINKATSYLQTNQLIILVENSIADSSLQTSTANWKNWLAEKYANGTPVIVYYRLLTPQDLQENGTPFETFESIPILRMQKEHKLDVSDGTISASKIDM